MSAWILGNEHNDNEDGKQYKMKEKEDIAALDGGEHQPEILLDSVVSVGPMGAARACNLQGPT